MRNIIEIVPILQNSPAPGGLPGRSPAPVLTGPCAAYLRRSEEIRCILRATAASDIHPKRCELALNHVRTAAVASADAFPGAIWFGGAAASLPLGPSSPASLPPAELQIPLHFSARLFGVGLLFHSCHRAVRFALSGHLKALASPAPSPHLIPAPRCPGAPAGLEPALVGRKRQI